MNNLVKDNISVNIAGKDYKVRELSLAQKIKLIGNIGEFIRDIAKNAFFKKNEAGNIIFSFSDEISLAELNIDKIILTSVGVLPELLALSVPDFNDWDNLPESDTRNVLNDVLKVNDFKGFIANFFSLAKTAIL